MSQSQIGDFYLSDIMSKTTEPKSNGRFLFYQSIFSSFNKILSQPFLFSNKKNPKVSQIPAFPDFCTLKDFTPEQIEEFTSHLPAYSDFSYSNLWSWNLGDKFKFSVLNNNLVIVFFDYDTREPFVYFVGNNKLNETAKELLLFAKANNYSSTLSLIPEEVATVLDKSLFTTEEDRDYHDYVFSVPDLAELAGGKFKSKRQLTKQFINNYPNFKFEQRKLDAHTKNITLDFLRNENTKRANSDKAYFLECESVALEDFFLMEANDQTYISYLYNEGELVGFSIDEIAKENYVMSHFFKVNLSYKGAYDTLNFLTAQKLRDLGLHYWNWAEDVGVKNLRAAKMAYRPIKFLKKYKVSLI